MKRWIVALAILLASAQFVDAQKLRLKGGRLRAPAPVNGIASAAWSKQTISGTTPGRNGYLGVLWDHVSRKVMWYGKTDAATTIYSTELWWWTTATHTATQVVGTGSTDNTASCATTDTASWPRDRHPLLQMTVDTLRNRVWMWGGVVCNNELASMYYLSLNASPASDAWTQVTSYGTAPSVKGIGGSLTYDSDIDALILFGPDSGSNAHLYIFCPSGSLSAAQLAAGCVNPQEWAEVTVAGGVYPGGEWFNHAVYYPVSHWILIYGGVQGGSTVTNETWKYTPSTKTFTQLCQGGCSAPTVYNGPTSPATFAMDYIPEIGKFIYAATHPSQVVYLYDPVGDTWSTVSTTGTASTFDSEGAWDPDNDTFVVHTRDAVSGGLAIYHLVVTFS